MSQLSTLKEVFDKHEFNKAITLISAWDFTLTKQKLLEPDYAGWRQERIEQAEEGYKRYLAVTKALNGYQLVPNGDIDRFWHEHILDTRRYVQDCESLFGGFLHHYPYFGMRNEVDNDNWLDAASDSTSFWSYVFSESLYDFQEKSAQKCPQACPGIEPLNNARLSPQKCPQSCPGIGSVYAIQKKPEKCPQSCPGIINAIDKGYPYLPAFNLKQVA